MPIYTSSPHNLPAPQNLIIPAARSGGEIWVGIAQFLHFATAVKKRFELFIGHGTFILFFEKYI